MVCAQVDIVPPSPSSNPSGHPALPQEMLDEIILHLNPSTDVPTLLSCALVSRSWHPSARVRLFTSVTIDVASTSGRALPTFVSFVHSCAHSHSALVPPHALVKNLRIYETLPAYTSKCVPRVHVHTLRTLLSTLPSLRTLALDNVYLDAELYHPLPPSPSTYGASIKSLSVSLDALEVNRNLGLLLCEFASIEELAVSVRFGRRIIDFPFLPSGFFVPERFCPAMARSLRIRSVSLDCEMHLPYLVRCLLHRGVGAEGEGEGLKEVKVRCYSDEDVAALRVLLHQHQQLEVLEIDAVHPSQQFPSPSLSPLLALPKLRALTLACPVYRPPVTVPCSSSTSAAREFPPIWTLLSPSSTPTSTSREPMEELRTLTLKLRIHGDTAHVLYTLRSLAWGRLEASLVLLVQQGLERVEVVRCVPRSCGEGKDKDKGEGEGEGECEIKKTLRVCMMELERRIELVVRVERVL